MSERPDTGQKAFEVNLDKTRYGSFAEIGAGQEVGRWFFRVGGAAGTIAKTMSAYDMQVSDAIYGKAERYVSRERLEAMLEHEYELNIERLAAKRGDETAFFAFADTVTAQNYRGTANCHGWMGIRFQAYPRADWSQILLHARMRDREALMQHEVIGILGVNLIYGASRLSGRPEVLIESLIDQLHPARIEIDMIEFSGDAFTSIDNRVMTLRLVELGLTPAAMFDPSGQVLQPAEVLYKRPVVLQRGRFRPPTVVHEDIQQRAYAALSREPEVDPTRIVALHEMTLHDFRSTEDFGVDDYLDRIHALAADGHVVLISNFAEYYRVAQYLDEHSVTQIALPLGAFNLLAILDESLYTKLTGGVLEASSRLFKSDVRVYVYPMLDPKTGERVELGDLRARIPEPVKSLYDYLLAMRWIQPLEGLPDAQLKILSDEVLAQIRSGDPRWVDGVTAPVAAAIRELGLFDFDQAP